MANGDLQFPAVDLDSFTNDGSGVNAANIWDAIRTGTLPKFNTNLIRSKMFEITGTPVGAAPVTQMVFDLSILNTNYDPFTDVKIKIQSINFGTQMANPIPGFAFAFANVFMPTFSPIVRGGFQVPILGAGQIVGIEINRNIKEAQTIGDPLQISLFQSVPLALPDFNQQIPIAAPTITFNIASAEFVPLQASIMIIEVEELF